MSPEELVQRALSERSFALAYTYSEPLIHAEYLLDAGRLARAAGLKNVLVSNGYINPEPAEEILSVMDAANIDLKAWDADFYRKETGGSLEEVKRFITQAAGRIHLEVTTLVIPGRNDDPRQIEGIARFLAGLNPAIPLHLSAYHPDFNYDVDPTPPQTVRKLAEEARRHLQFVYAGNLGGEHSDTACPHCGHVLVSRRGYAVSAAGISGGKCASCGKAVPIVGA